MLRSFYPMEDNERPRAALNERNITALRCGVDNR